MTKAKLKQHNDKGHVASKSVECRVVLNDQNAARSQSMTATKVAKEVERDLRLLKKFAF